MGACFQSMIIKKSKNVKKVFDAVRQEDLHQNGHQYSGGFGMTRGVTLTNMVFKDERTAEDWLSDQDTKYGNALGVTVEGRDDEWLIGAWCAE